MCLQNKIKLKHTFIKTSMFMLYFKLSEIALIIRVNVYKSCAFQC